MRDYYRGTLLTTVIVLVSLGSLGCPPLSGYFASVTAHIAPQPTDTLRSAVLGLGGFEGPLKIAGSSPNCFHYNKRLPTSGVSVDVFDCSGPTKASETGWAYRVYISTRTEGLRDEVKKEIDRLVEEIQKVVQQRVGRAKVTKHSGPFGNPLI